MVSATTPVWSDETLDRLKKTADPLADDCMVALIADGDIAEANAVLARIDTETDWPDDTPAPLQAYLDATAQLPPGTDLARIASAQHVFSTFGLQFGVSLLCRSLPVLYAGKIGGSQVLAATGKLTDHFARRASETLRFILNAAEPGGLAPGGQGLLTIRKVRLMHAAVRHYAKSSTHWPDGCWPQDWGEPINQEELVGTMLAFSLEAVEGLRELGVELGASVQEDQLYLWKTIGLVLGIVPEAMPADITAARQIWAALERRNFGASDAGHLLTQSHIAFLQQNLPDIAHGLVPDLMATLLGRRNAQYLGLRNTGWWAWLVDTLKMIFRIKTRLAGSSHTAQGFMVVYGDALMDGLQRYWAGPNPGRPFRIPDRLKT
ncbi:oxygenase MpaB family protein [Andreprevotia chitinilytica]|uniref:oxygenase MpaB family protein n=1 Tax=Andreprevotia chitinilytica TaxID=396808 RepID=UPI00054DB965|nr:oxygenase MpaB family protein [Andreprevotia chitinilytica]